MKTLISSVLVVLLCVSCNRKQKKYLNELPNEMEKHCKETMNFQRGRKVAQKLADITEPLFKAERNAKSIPKQT